MVRVCQSESERAGAGHHIAVCGWYVPDEPIISHPQAGAVGQTGPSEGYGLSSFMRAAPWDRYFEECPRISPAWAWLCSRP